MLQDSAFQVVCYVDIERLRSTGHDVYVVAHVARCSEEIPFGSAQDMLRFAQNDRCCGSPLHLTVPEAARGVVVDHADGLHEGVADGGADESEAAFLEILREGI